jgi:uncharacterized membrane protein
VLALTAIGYVLRERCIIRCNGPDSRLARAVGEDTQEKISLSMYLAAMPLAFVRPWIAIMLYVVVAGMWLVPDRRIEDLNEAGTETPSR